MTDAVYASSTATTALTTRSYTYYPTGALKSVTENGVTLTYTYDERGNVLTESDGTSVKTYTYNLFGARASYTLKVSGVTTASETYAYDVVQRLASVTTDNAVVQYAYDMLSNRTSDVTYNKTTGLAMYGHNYTFDAASRVTQVQGLATMADSSVVLPVLETYAYNLDGSMSSKTDNIAAVSTTYAYDGAGRLTLELEGTSATTYTYDAANNRTTKVSGGVTTTYTYDANNRLLSEVEGTKTTTYTYDANGNQLSGNGLITYDARGRQSTWTNGLTTASYTYYPNDLRKSKTVGVITTNYVWDGQNMVYEYNGTNTTGGTAYYYGLTLISQGNYAYYLYNGHGDVVQLVTASGTLGRSYDYDAFGNEVSPSATDTNPFRYAGQYFDSETGTYYLRARYYDPGIGRFTQQDGWTYANPSDSLSLNLYTYCWNDPIQYYDPNGHSGLGIMLLIGAMVLLTGCGRTTYSSTEEEANNAIVSYMLTVDTYETMDEAAWAAADTFYTDYADTPNGREKWLDIISKYEYQVNILLNEENGKYYITVAYSDGAWGEVHFQDHRPNDSYKVVATLHTHSQIKDDLDSVFSKDKDNLPEYEKYVLETDGMRGRLVYYNRNKDKTEVKSHWGDWEE